MKIHFCCGDVYLKGYINIDIDGILIGDYMKTHEKNPNETTLAKYFKRPFETDSTKRKPNPFLIDRKDNILGNMDKSSGWTFGDSTIDEIVMVSAFEHFEHKTEIPYIINEAYRTLKPGGTYKFDFPDIKKTVELYYDSDPEFCMELIYCNHKNKYSIHNWGYTEKSIYRYFDPNKWELEFDNFVKHDYPMIGVIAKKKSES